MVLLVGTVRLWVGFRDRTFVYFNPPYAFAATCDGWSVVMGAAEGSTVIKVYRDGPGFVDGLT